MRRSIMQLQLVLAALHSTGTHHNTDTIKMVRDCIQKTLLSVASPPTDTISDVASNPTLRLFECQAIGSKWLEATWRMVSVGGDAIDSRVF